jgi:succinate dehydrogenase / fumarate reductase iron-sulfur subunit
MEEASTIRVNVKRSQDGRMDEYVVPVEPGMSIFNVLDWIRNEIDPTLAFPISCRIGKCDICLLKVDGKTRWSCTEPPYDGVVLEPLDRYEVLKDVVIDWEKKRAPRSSEGALTTADGSEI